MRRRLLLAGLGITLALGIFALFQFFAIRRLTVENDRLRSTLVKMVEDHGKEVGALIEEHRREQRDRYFDLKQTVQLEGVRTRDAMKEVRE